MSTAKPTADDFLRAVEIAHRDAPVRLTGPDTNGVRQFSYDDGELHVSGRARMEGQTALLLSVEVRASTPDAPVTAAQVRMLPVGRIMAGIQSASSADDAHHQVRAALAEAGKEPKPQKSGRGGRPTVTAELLRQVAEAYLDETAEGKPPRPLERMAERFGRPQETVRTWIARARREGWLTPAIKGRLGSEPGPRLIAYRLAVEAGLLPGKGETDEEREARMDRLHEFANQAGERWQQMRDQQDEDNPS